MKGTESERRNGIVMGCQQVCLGPLQFNVTFTFRARHQSTGDQTALTWLSYSVLLWGSGGRLAAALHILPDIIIFDIIIFGGPSLLVSHVGPSSRAS